MKTRNFYLTIVFLCVRYGASVEREQTFVIDKLSTASVTVDIHSEIPGLMTWEYTDELDFTIKVKIYAESEVEINSTRVNLSTTNSAVLFLINENHFPIAHAPVTGTGCSIPIPAYLVWLLGILIGWNNPMTIVLTALVYGLSPGLAGETVHIQRKTVEVEVKAPRRLEYKTIYLYINGGKLRVADSVPQTAVIPTCKTKSTSDGCPNCCNGHGVCTQNRCICDTGYDQESNCAMSRRQSVFFSHPFDPRFERTVLQNDDVLTLGRAFQYIQEPPYLKDPNVYAMEIRSRHFPLSHVLVVYNTDGFIEELFDLHSLEKSVVKLKKSKTQECLLHLKGNLINFELNICDMYKQYTESPANTDQFTLKNEQEIVTNSKNRRKSKRKRQKIQSKLDYKLLEFPVRIERCGFNSPDSEFVYFQLDAVRGDNSNIARRLSLNINERITLLSHDKQKDTFSLRLPNNMVPVGTDEMSSKCKLTMSIRNKICSSANVHGFKIICDHLLNYTDTKNTTPSQFSRTAELCMFVMKTVSVYCDNSDSVVFSQDLPCLANYFESFNLFSNDTYYIRPIAHFPDGKIITGVERKVNLGDHQGNEVTELAIIDNEAEFRIVKISVIPKDPVPHDIYQVKLDYACATSETVIKMTVYGSDFYNNDVICKGTTSCNCCILHAAGAPNAVVDHVTINVTDYSRNYNHVREMVVVF